MQCSILTSSEQSKHQMEYQCDASNAIHLTRSISLTSLESLSRDEEDDQIMSIETHTNLLPRNLVEERDGVESWIQTMRRQELKNYMCNDYLKQHQVQGDLQGNKRFYCAVLPREGLNSNKNNDKRMVDEFCREQICEWCFRVVDYFNVSRDVVAISISYLDRFVSKCACDRKTFKLAATTCLFIACKLHEPGRNLNFLGILTNLSRGEFSEHHITEMEKVILHTLEWMVNPPIPSWYVNHYVKMSPFSILSPDAVANILDQAGFYTELAVMDFFFVCQRPSLVGLASILEVMEATPLHEIPEATRQAFDEVIARIMPDLNLRDLHSTRSKLRKIYRRSQEPVNEQSNVCADSPTRHNDGQDLCTSHPETRSPACVSEQERKGSTAYAA